MLVSDLLAGKGSRVVTIESAATVEAAINLLTEARIGALLVVDGGQVRGILSERDLIRRLSRDGRGVLDGKVADVMTRDVISCTPEDTIDHVMQEMTTRRFRHLPVMRNDRLVGLVSIGDVVKGLIDEARREAEDLRQYIVAG